MKCQASGHVIRGDRIIARGLGSNLATSWYLGIWPWLAIIALRWILVIQPGLSG